MMNTCNASTILHFASRAKKLIFQMGSSVSPNGHLSHRSWRSGLLVVFALAVVTAAAFYSAPSSASSLMARSMFAPAESVATFAGDCVTPKTDFNLGDTVCAQVSNASGQRLSWTGPYGLIMQITDITTNTQNVVFTIPGTGTSSVGGQTVDNRGTWKVASIDSRAWARAVASFTVRDPAQTTADLVVYRSISLASSDFADNGNITTSLYVANKGPDTATNVQVTNAVPPNTTFLSFSQDSGPTFNCTNPSVGGTGTTTCNIASLAKGTPATFTIVYKITTASPDIAITGTATSSTFDTNSSDNSSTPITPIGNTGGGGSGSGCTITCPSNIVQNNDPGQEGANVTYTASTSGSCGPLTYDPPSGSFFPIGTTQVQVTDGTGSSCSFVVTVNDANGITIKLNAPPGTCTDINGNTGPCPASPLLVECHTSFTDPGATAKNGAGQTISYTTQVFCEDETTGNTVPCSLNINKPGLYTFVYTATDGTQSESVSRAVFVVDTTPPVIALNGPNPLTVECHTTFTDPGATANDSCAGSFAATASGVVDVNTPGTYTITYEASDTAGNDATPKTRTVIVVDTTAPIVTAPPNVTVYTGAGATSCSVTVSNATLGTASANDACAGTVAVTRSGVPSGNVFPVGTTTVTYSATDAYSNTGTATQTVTVIDNTPPTSTCPANIIVYLPLNSTATSMAVSYPAATATDNCSSPTITYSKASGSVFNVGPTTVTATATDAAGNTTTCSFTVTVLYNFTGFFQPIDNLPTLNQVNAGRSIPIKFSLSGDKGLNIFAAGYPASGVIACNSTDPVVDVTETGTAGNSSLSFGGNQYVYTWKTESSWAGTCRQLVVKLNDGSEHRANFKFK